MAGTQQERAIASRLRWPMLVVAAAIAFNLWSFRQELDPPQPINDTAIHASLATWVQDRVTSGAFPLDGWYPPVSLGASRLHHYQALPYVLTGSAQALIADAFPWITYLLLSGWPAVVYAASRRLELSEGQAAVAAVVAPLIRSVPGFGYESLSYTWFGPGLWPQLWAMWTLPLAIAWSWRAIAGTDRALVAALLGGATICLHLPTGYLFMVLLVVMPLASTRELGWRIGRAAAVGVGALTIAAWQVVPALLDARWTAVDQVAAVRFRWDSFGAGQVLTWLGMGELLDVGRLPIVTVLAALGVIASVAARPMPEGHRVIALVGVVSLVLFFGRPTLGVLADLLPLGSSLSFRRFIVGVHLSAILLAGIGGVWLATAIRGLTREAAHRIRPAFGRAAVATLAAGAVLVGYGSAVDLRGFERELMDRQHVIDRGSGRAFAGLVAAARRDGGFRVYAGTNARPGSVYRIGRAPSYIALLNAGADVVGYRRPTWSFLSGVEARFDPRDADQYAVLGVSHAILRGSAPPLPEAERVRSAGDLTLWRVGGGVRPLAVGRATGTITVDRSELAARMGAYLATVDAGSGTFSGLAYDGLSTAPPRQSDDGRVGSVVAARAVSPGHHVGTVRMPDEGIVVLRSSFDPGWEVEIDGVAADLHMVAPGFPAIVVQPGTHRVSFRYDPGDRYPALLLVGILGIVGVAAFDGWGRRRAAGPPAGPPD